MSCLCRGGTTERIPQPKTGVRDLPGPRGSLAIVDGLELFTYQDDAFAYNDARYNAKQTPGKEDFGTWNLDCAGWPAAICRASTIPAVQAVVKYAKEHCAPAGIFQDDQIMSN